MHVALRRSTAHVVVADVDLPELDAESRHHLERVLRLRPGTEITVTDGAGQWRTCITGANLATTSAVFVEPRGSTDHDCMRVDQG